MTRHNPREEKRLEPISKSPEENKGRRAGQSRGSSGRGTPSGRGCDAATVSKRRNARRATVAYNGSGADATFVMAKGGGAEVGATKRGKGMKIMAIVDRHGLPLSVSTHAANHHEVRLVQLCFDFYMVEAKPENLIGDRAYDSDPLDEELRKDGIEM